MGDKDKDMQKVWDHQFKAANVKTYRMALPYKCLNLKLMSTCTYHALRTSGLITLPSERTLQDHTNLFQQRLGYQSEVINQLVQEVNSMNLREKNKYVGIPLDEMKIKEGLMYK